MTFTINIEIQQRFFKEKDNKFWCSFCDKGFKLQKNNCFNLRRHFEGTHNTEYQLFLNGINSKDSSESTFLNLKSPEMTFIKFIVLSKLPLDIVNNPSLINFVKDLNPKTKVPSKYKIENEIENIAKKQQEFISKLVSSEENQFSFLLDVWNYNRKLVLGVKIKICDKNGDLSNYTLDFISIKSQTAADIIKNFENSLISYNIDKSRVSSVCTDNCATMIKFQKLFEESKNIYVDELMELQNKLDSESIIIQYNTNEYVYTGCFIHLLQNICKKIEKEVPILNEIMEKMLDIIKILKRKEYNEFNIFIAIPIDIRWFSRIRTLHSFLNKWDTIKNIIREVKITENELKILKNYLKITYPILLIAKDLEKDDFYISDFFSWKKEFIKFLKEKLPIFNSETPVNLIISSFISLFSTKIQPFEDANSFLINKALFLNPLKINTLSELEKATIINEIESRFESEVDPLFEEEIENYSSVYKLETEIGNLIEDEDEKEDDGVMSSFGNKIAKVSSKTFDDEILQYIFLSSKEKIDRGKFWKIYNRRLPNLFREYQRISVMCIGNGSIERLFSVAKSLSYWKRNRIGVKKMKNLMMCDDFFSRVEK